METYLQELEASNVEIKGYVGENQMRHDNVWKT